MPQALVCLAFRHRILILETCNKLYTIDTGSEENDAFVASILETLRHGFRFGQQGPSILRS